MTEKRLILGTAGHIDHGKTALVKLLTGVDTDRLQEEKARGITIELGFADFAPREDLRMGVVDVPGHEGFIRNMLAGATGMDLVLMVVAADEGMMPQTQEHLQIVRLLGVEQMVVALTKSDLVEEEWLPLVEEEVREALRESPYSAAPVVVTSTVTGAGIETLKDRLVEVAERAGKRSSEDLVRLPIDRAFTVRGTGTVVTGTLWSGRLSIGDPVVLQPSGVRGRVRGLQVLPGLRHHSLIGRHHHQDQVHTGGAREHVANEALVARDVHHAHPKVLPGNEVCESELDRDAAGLLLLQAIRIHTGQ